MLENEPGSYEWDIAKEAHNIQKHKVDFYIASRVFIDPKRVVYLDVVHSVDETRYFCIGKVDSRILTVRFVFRAHKIRILGAGYWRKGERLYEEENR